MSKTYTQLLFWASKSKKRSKKKTRMMKKRLLYLICILALCIPFLFLSTSQNYSVDSKRLWDFASIDTMKYSRDLSREKLQDPTFDQVISSQIKAIAQTEATHVPIATPYDD